MPAFVAVGIDCSDQFHDIYADAPGVLQPLRLRITNDLAGFQRLLETLRERFPELPCRFALENPRLLLARFLLHSQQAVFAVNPRSVARMREALAPGGKKNDPLDAESACLLLRRREAELTPVPPSTGDPSLLDGLVRQRVDLVEQKTRLLNQLQVTLKAYYPRALELFPNLEQPFTLHFLATFSSPQALAAATREDWQALFTGQRYPRPHRISALWEQAQAPQVPVSPVDAALGQRLQRGLGRQLAVVLEELQAVEAAIKTCFEALPDAEIFQSLPGAADALAPALCALFGDDRTRWRSWQAVARHSGSIPVTRSSGQSRMILMRFHCDKRARRTLHLFAGCSRQHCAWAGAFYAEQRRKGKTHAAALRNLATKWLRILFRLWQDRTTYDEARYLQRHAERRAPRAPAEPDPVEPAAPAGVRSR